MFELGTREWKRKESFYEGSQKKKGDVGDKQRQRSERGGKQIERLSRRGTAVGTITAQRQRVTRHTEKLETICLTRGYVKNVVSSGWERRKKPSFLTEKKAR